MALDLPRIFLLSTHLQPGELHELEDQITSLTYDINEAEIVLGKISRRERALFELRRLKLETIPAQSDSQRETSVEPSDTPSHKRRRISDHAYEAVRPSSSSGTAQTGRNHGTIKVLKLAWLRDSVARGEVLPIDEYLLYEGIKVSPRTTPNPVSSSPILSSLAPNTGILQRAVEDQSSQSSPTNASPKSRYQRSHTLSSPLLKPRPKLVHQTTSEHDLPLPLIPEFLTTTYSCQRPTPVDPPNEDFISALKGIRTIRLLHGDQVGVRAYSTSIATLAAYPYLLQSPQGASYHSLSHVSQLTQNHRGCQVTRLWCQDCRAVSKMEIIRTFERSFGSRI